MKIKKVKLSLEVELMAVSDIEPSLVIVGMPKLNGVRLTDDAYSGHLIETIYRRLKEKGIE